MGWVGSTPSFALSGTFTVLARDEGGKTLRTFKAEASRPFSFALPAHYSGIVSLSVEPSGPYARLRAERAYAIAGDPLPAFARASQSARNALTRLPPGRRYSTLSFLADQLDGKTDPSLATFPRQTAAAYRVAELLAEGVDEKTEFTGLKQWAYRSILDGSDQPYSLYLPDGFDSGKAYPLIVTLHGYSGTDYDQAKSIASLAPADYIIVAPFGRGDLGYRLQGERDVLDVLDLIQARYRIDADRVYLMGSSMGGMGTWRIGQLYPDRFAAIAPFCGWSGTDYLGNLGGLGVLIVHGDDDPTVSIYSDRQAASYLGSLGYDLRFDSLPGVGHNAWTAWAATFGGESIFTFFSARKRDPWPKQVSLAAPRELYGKKAWVRIDAFAMPRSPARLSAEIVDGRHLEVIADSVKGFTLDLRHPALEKKGRILVRVNGYDVPADAGKEARFVREVGSDRFSLARSGIASAPLNAGGGLADLFMKPLYVVVGTKDKRATAALASFARNLCAWRPSAAMGIGSKVGAFRVIEDKALTTEMAASASLILLGSARENSVTERMTAALPAEFGAGKVRVGGKAFKKAGLIMVRPNPEATGQLVSVIALPKRGRPMDRFAENLAQSLRLYRGTDDDIAGVTTADVMVFNERGSILWQAAYDSEWKELLPLK
jgi:enterochelin esterase-like enzyme